MTHIRDVPDLRARYSDLGVPVDLARLECSWIFSTTTNKNDDKSMREKEHPLPLTKSSHFCVTNDMCAEGNKMDAEAEEEEGEEEDEEDEEDEAEVDSFFASVLLLSGDPMHSTRDEYVQYIYFVFVFCFCFCFLLTSS